MDKLNKLKLSLDKLNYSESCSKIFKSFSKEYSYFKCILSKLDYINNNLNDLFDFFYLLQTDGFKDNDILLELNKKIQYLTLMLNKMELEILFTDSLDKYNTFIDITAGSGGVDAQDWTHMLLKMYISWSNNNGYKYEIMYISHGQSIGIKSVSLKIIGIYAYGWLKFENGIHRLIRKSPYNFNKKRHTSFSSVFVYPDNESDFEIEINNSDLKVDTFKSSGAGGQHVNKTDSAVRIKHLPTNIVIKCQSNRSQHKNKSQALKQLKSKLNKLYLLKKLNNKKKLELGKSEISWGNQIRSYVFDKSMVKDLRSGIEINDVNFVLDGNIESFIFPLLKKKR